MRIEHNNTSYENQCVEPQVDQIGDLAAAGVGQTSDNERTLPENECVEPQADRTDDLAAVGSD